MENHRSYLDCHEEVENVVVGVRTGRRAILNRSRRGGDDHLARVDEGCKSGISASVVSEKMIPLIRLTLESTLCSPDVRERGHEQRNRNGKG